jgi:Ca2+:H+ antiporter
MEQGHNIGYSITTSETTTSIHDHDHDSKLQLNEHGKTSNSSSTDQQENNNDNTGTTTYNTTELQSHRIPTVKEGLMAIVKSSWINPLVVFIPFGIASHFVWSPTITFVLNFIAIVPLAKLLGFATEELALYTGEVSHIIYYIPIHLFLLNLVYFVCVARKNRTFR